MRKNVLGVAKKVENWLILALKALKGRNFRELSVFYEINYGKVYK